MEKISLTKKQQETLNYIKECLSKNEKSPTIQEIADNFKITLRSVTQRLDYLEEKGFIVREKHAKRGIRIMNTNHLTSDGVMVEIPVIASAGCDAMEVYAQEDFGEYLIVERGLTKGVHDIAAVKAIGSSMIDAGIHHGDYVLVEVTEDVADGDRVVAVVDDMAVIKKIKKKPPFIILEPESKEGGYSSIVVKEENSRIFGKVLSIIPASDNHKDDDLEFVYEPDVNQPE